MQRRNSRHRAVRPTSPSAGRAAGSAYRPPAVEPLEGRVLLSAADQDVTFGVGGRAVGTPYTGYTAVAVAPGGKYVVVGDRASLGPTGHDFHVARFNANGTPDTAFGGGAGWVATDFGGELESATAVAVLSNGKILAAGYGYAADGRTSRFCVARYNVNGTLDASFGGGDGKTITAFYGRTAYTGALKVLGSGKFLVAGTTSTLTGAGADFSLARFNADGSPDASFGPWGTGKVNFVLDGSQEATGVAVNAAGQIYVAGTHRPTGDADSDFAVARFTAGGKVDTAFGGGKGWVRTNFASASNPRSQDDGNAMTLTAAGKVLVVGRSAADGGGPARFAVAQYNANGSLDTSFGNGTGKVLTNLNPDPLSDAKPSSATNLIFNAQAVAVAAGGKFVVAGYAVGTTYDPLWGTVVAETRGYGVARYNANGTLDPTFGVNGRKVGTTVESVLGVTIDGAGKIVLAGNTTPTGVLVRLGTPAAATASIAGTFFNDRNGDGVRQTATEPPLADWQAYVDANNNGVYDYGEPTGFTNAAGAYSIKGLTAGTYRVREVRKDGWTRTVPAGAWPLGYYDVKLTTGLAVGGKVFGNRKT